MSDFHIRNGEVSKFCRGSGRELGYACSGPAGRARWGPGIGHGRETFPYGTSSHTQPYTIDFINPDWYLLGKNATSIKFSNHKQLVPGCIEAAFIKEKLMLYVSSCKQSFWCNFHNSLTKNASLSLIRFQDVSFENKSTDLMNIFRTYSTLFSFRISFLAHSQRI